jgi:hypothetical protein
VMPDVSSNLKVKVECPCGCGAFGMPTKKRGHPRGCKCRPCVAGRNSRQGKAAHRKIARDMGAAGPGRGATSHEESFVHSWRVEIKSGQQAFNVVTRFVNSRNQSEASRAIGDHRPFAAIYTTRRKGDPTVVSIDFDTWKAITLLMEELVA